MAPVDRSFQQPVVAVVVPGVDTPFEPTASALQGVPMVKPASGFVADVAAEASGFCVGSATSGLVTGSRLVVVGRPSSGLTPRLPISSEPSGMPTRLDVVAVVVAMPEGALDVVAQLLNTVESVGFADEIPPTADDVAPAVAFVVPPTPPPSKLDRVESSAVIADSDVGAVEHPAPPMELSGDTEPAVVVGEIEIVVLKPPGLISTEPRGIPVGPTVVSGDVAPMAGGVAVITCAKLGPLGNSVETVMAISKPAIQGLWSFRIGITRLRSRRGAGRVSRMFATGFRREL